MAFHIFSKLSTLKGAVLPSSKAQSFSWFSSSSDASCVFCKLKANAKSFFNKLGEITNSALNGEVSVLQEKRKDVLTICNAKRVKDIKDFPPEVFASNELLFELFELWMVEYNKSYSSEEEKMDRFEVFKGGLARVAYHNKWYQATLKANGASMENICYFKPHYNMDRRAVEGPKSLHFHYQRMLEEDNKLIMKMKKAVNLLV